MIKKQSKFVGGASGPMQINKLVGPNAINPIKSPKLSQGEQMKP